MSQENENKIQPLHIEVNGVASPLDCVTIAAAHAFTAIASVAHFCNDYNAWTVVDVNDLLTTSDEIDERMGRAMDTFQTALAFFKGGFETAEMMLEPEHREHQFANAVLMALGTFYANTERIRNVRDFTGGEDQ